VQQQVLVMRRLMTVNVKISRGRGQPHDQAINVLLQDDLACQSGVFLEEWSQIQHVFLLLIKLLVNKSIVVVLNVHMARAARQTRLARALNVEIVSLRQIHNIISFPALYCVLDPVSVNVRYSDWCGVRIDFTGAVLTTT